MIVKTITYGRKFNLGNYQTENIEMTAELGPEDNRVSAFLSLKAMVLASAGHTQEAEALIARAHAVERGE